MYVLVYLAGLCDWYVDLLDGWIGVSSTLNTDVLTFDFETLDSDTTFFFFLQHEGNHVEADTDRNSCEDRVVHGILFDFEVEATARECFDLLLMLAHLPLANRNQRRVTEILNWTQVAQELMRMLQFNRTRHIEINRQLSTHSLHVFHVFQMEHGHCSITQCSLLLLSNCCLSISRAHTHTYTKHRLVKFTHSLLQKCHIDSSGSN